MNPIVVHVVRPFDSEQAYLAAEAWSIDARGMLLIEVEPLQVDTLVLFDVALADGHKPIRAEGRVVGAVEPDGSRPGGLRIRFKRFGAATKAFIERAVKTKQGALERPSMTELERPSMTELERPSMTELERPSMTSNAEPGSRPSATEIEASFVREPSGVRRRQHGPVAPPSNRDELLARLRGRKSSSR